MTDNLEFVVAHSLDWCRFRVDPGWNHDSLFQRRTQQFSPNIELTVAAFVVYPHTVCRSHGFRHHVVDVDAWRIAGSYSVEIKLKIGLRRKIACYPHRVSFIALTSHTHTSADRC